MTNLRSFILNVAEKFKQQVNLVRTSHTKLLDRVLMVCWSSESISVPQILFVRVIVALVLGAKLSDPLLILINL